jgi:hypothetical protein
MIAVQVQCYLNRARDFLKGMELLQDDMGEFRYSSALLGIHGAISYCDALRIGLGSGKVSSDDHRQAAVELKSLLAARKFEKQQGTNRLEKLLGKKSRIAYARDAAGEVEINEIVVQAQRFAAWAEDAGKALKIEGW